MTLVPCGGSFEFHTEAPASPGVDGQLPGAQPAEAIVGGVVCSSSPGGNTCAGRGFPPTLQGILTEVICCPCRDRRGEDRNKTISGQIARDGPQKMIGVSSLLLGDS